MEFSFGLIGFLIVFPLIIVAELTLLRKWCHRFCPISALMSLIGKANRTFVPQVNDAKCRETVEGASCEVCAAVCPQGINVRHPEAGMSFSECTKCRACVEACPTGGLMVVDEEELADRQRQRRMRAAVASGAFSSVPLNTDLN